MYILYTVAHTHRGHESRPTRTDPGTKMCKLQRDALPPMLCMHADAVLTVQLAPAITDPAVPDPLLYRTH